MFREAASFNQNLCSWKDKSFPYSTPSHPSAGDIFTDSGCTFTDDPVMANGGPFCGDDCLPSSLQPSMEPTNDSTLTLMPSLSSRPTLMPSSSSNPSASGKPSNDLTLTPSSSSSEMPSSQPSESPSDVPSSSSVTSAHPSGMPSSQPSQEPSNEPSLMPSSLTSSQTLQPSSNPSISMTPSITSMKPSTTPSSKPSSSSRPSLRPSSIPSASAKPSNDPTLIPSSSSHPSLTPSFIPSTSTNPSGSPSQLVCDSQTKYFTNTDEKARERAKGLMFQMLAKSSDVVIEKISFKSRGKKDTEVQVYFQLGSYATFPSGGMKKGAWGEPIFDGIPVQATNGLKEAILDEVFIIPKGTMASFYLASKKEFMFVDGGDDENEFEQVSAETEDFKLFTGSAMAKPFKERLSSANFFGELTYCTYTGTFFDTPNVDTASDKTKGVMFSITAKSKQVTITGLGVLGKMKDVQQTAISLYYQNGRYDDFDSLEQDNWIRVFRRKMFLEDDEITAFDLDDNEITIHVGGTVSLYVLSQKGGMLFQKASSDTDQPEEFDVYAENDDFALRVGVSTKKRFRNPNTLAEFVGRIMYET